MSDHDELTDLRHALRALECRTVRDDKPGSPRCGGEPVVGFCSQCVEEHAALLRERASQEAPPAVPAPPSGARQQEEQTASRAASAASLSDSGLVFTAKLIRELAIELGAHRLGADARLSTIAAHALVLSEDLGSAEAAAYARGLAERDARWREALRQWHGSTWLAFMRDEPSERAAPLRALLGSAATEAQPPPSPSGALAGSGEMTQATNQQRAGTPRAPDRGGE